VAFRLFRLRSAAHAFFTFPRGSDVAAPIRAAQVSHAIGTFAFAIEAYRGAGAIAPEWITLIPAANFKGFDGRGPYRLDQPDHVVAATEEMIAKHMTAGLPLDFDHATMG
jgi:hypothetical protein